MRYISILSAILLCMLLSIPPAISRDLAPIGDQNTSSDRSIKKTREGTVPVTPRQSPAEISPKSSVNSVTEAKPGIRAKPMINPGTLVIGTIKVLQPAKNAALQEGGQTQIVFESNLKAPFTIELVKFNSKERVMECQVAPIVQQGGGNTFITVWELPDWSYNPLIKYGIRVSKGGTEAFSEPFRIKNVLKTTVYTIPATTTSNKYQARARNAKTNRETPDPGPGRLRVGYYHFSKDEHSVNYVYRSWVFFDLSSLAGKGLVTKAVLKFSHYAGCNTFTPFVSILNSRWNGSADDLFYTHDVSGVNPSVMPVARVTDWIANPQNNYGLVFVGPNEALGATDNDVCIAFYDNVALEVELTGE